MSNIKIVSDDEEFEALLKAAKDELVVIDFFTTWCRPCRSMEPVVERLAVQYPRVLFLKVDADKCFTTAMNYKVSGVPFFVIHFNSSALETVHGANEGELESKIQSGIAEVRQRLATAQDRSNMSPSANAVVSTYGKLGSVAPFVDASKSRCINDLSPTSFHNFLSGKKLVSGRGTGKILLLYSFTQKLMLQSFKIKANPQSGPKVLRFFVNHPKVLDFSVGSTLAPSQEVTLSPHDLTGERAIELRSGSFQVVTNLQIFVISGQSKNSRIEIESLQLFGAPITGVHHPIPVGGIPSIIQDASKIISSAVEQDDSVTTTTTAQAVTTTPSEVVQGDAVTQQHQAQLSHNQAGHSRNLVEARHNNQQPPSTPNAHHRHPQPHHHHHRH